MKRLDPHESDDELIKPILGGGDEVVRLRSDKRIF